MQPGEGSGRGMHGKLDWCPFLFAHEHLQLSANRHNIFYDPLPIPILNAVLVLDPRGWTGNEYQLRSSCPD